MEWWLLIPSGALYLVYAYFSYDPACRLSWWFVPVSVIFGAAQALLWALIIRFIINDQNRIYVYSLFWDAMMMSIYYFLPIILFGVRLDARAIFGLSLMVIGLAIVKLTT